MNPNTQPDIEDQIESEKNKTRVTVESVPIRMMLSDAFPPNFDKIKDAFPNVEPWHSAFTYGDVIYVPKQKTDEIGQALLQHEVQHSEQQDMIGSPDVWWSKWIADKKFRLDQEGEAYARQYWFFCSGHKDRNVRAKFLHRLCSDLSGKMYGEICTYEEAKKMILNG